MEQGGGQRQAGVGGHAGGGGVDDAVGLGQHRGQPVGGGTGGASGPEVPVQLGGEGGGPLGQRVDDGDLPGAQGERGVGDGRARAAGAELHDPLQRRVGQAPGEGRGEAGDVRVVTGGPAGVVEDDRVDRAERLGLRGERVQVLDDELLARVGDVQPVEAEVPGGAQQVAHGLGRHPEGVDVDQPVQVAQALPVGLPLVQGRAERRADAGADQSDEIRVLGHRGPPERLGSTPERPMYEPVR